MSQEHVKEEIDREVQRLLSENPNMLEFVARIKASAIVGARQTEATVKRSEAMASHCLES